MCSWRNNRIAADTTFSVGLCVDETWYKSTFASILKPEDNVSTWIFKDEPRKAWKQKSDQRISWRNHNYEVVYDVQHRPSFICKTTKYADFDSLVTKVGVDYHSPVFQELKETLFFFSKFVIDKHQQNVDGFVPLEFASAPVVISFNCGKWITDRRVFHIKGYLPSSSYLFSWKLDGGVALPPPLTEADYAAAYEHNMMHHTSAGAGLGLFQSNFSPLYLREEFLANFHKNFFLLPCAFQLPNSQLQLYGSRVVPALLLVHEQALVGDLPLNGISGQQALEWAAAFSLKRKDSAFSTLRGYSFFFVPLPSGPSNNFISSGS